jgi:hypothetical protein
MVIAMEDTNMAENVFNSFFNAYKEGANIREDRAVQDAKNTFAEVWKDREKYGGEIGAYKELASRFGETGNLQGFNMAKQALTAYEADRDKKRAQAEKMLGGAALSIYAMPDDADWKGVYKKTKEYATANGVDTSTWKSEKDITKDDLAAFMGASDQIKAFHEMVLGKQTAKAKEEEVAAKKTTAEAARTRAQTEREEFEWAKTHPGFRGRGGTGEGKDSSDVQLARLLVTSGAVNPKTKKPYTKAEAAAEILYLKKFAKTADRATFKARVENLLGAKAAKKLMEDYDAEHGVEGQAEAESWEDFLQ